MQKQLSEKKLDAETTFDRFQSIDSGEFFFNFYQIRTEQHIFNVISS